MKTLEELHKIRQKAQSELQQRSSDSRYKVVVGMGTSGIAMGAREIMKVIIGEIAKWDINDVIVSQTGEKGLSSMEPVIDVIQTGKPTITYGNLTPEKVRRIVTEHLVNDHPLQEFIVTTRD